LQLLDKLLFYKIAPRQVRYLRPLDYGRAEGLAAATIEQMEQDFVVGPPITVHLCNPELMAGVWSMARECLAAGQKRRALGEVVASAVSRLNTCTYCDDIHSSMLYSFRLPSFEATETQALADWAGATLSPGSELLATPPFPTEEVPQFYGAAVCFHYLNRMVNVFLDPSPFLISGNGWLKKSAIGIAGKTLRPRLRNQILDPGRFLNEVPAIPLPGDFAWAAPNPLISGGILRFISAAQQAGIESVEPQVRACVLNHMERWQGEAPGLSRQWVEQAVAPLDDDHRPAARLALLTARAAWQVDEQVVADFRRRQSSDRDFINLTSWASYVATRRIASWLTSLH
jgi:AhpD family alkylhydroperoxidase